MQHVDIKLATGNVLSIDYNDEFIDKVRVSLNIPRETQVTHDHIKAFIRATVTNAVDTYEQTHDT